MEATVSYLSMLQRYINLKQDTEIKDYALCLGNVSTIFRLIIWKKTELKGVVKFFSVDFNPLDSNNILDNHRNVMQKTWNKTIFALIKNIFIGILSSIVNASNHKK